MNKTITLIPGDGIGKEVTDQTVKVLKKIAEKFNHTFTFQEGLIGATVLELILGITGAILFPVYQEK